jgi:DNA-binding transcriptional ArsR family regulator
MLKRMNPTKTAPGAAIDKLAQTFGECTALFFAMGDPVRQQIIMLLAEAEGFNVSEITERLPLSRPAISHHLKVLRLAGLVDRRRQGTENVYFLTIEEALELLKRFVAEVEECEA